MKALGLLIAAALLEVGGAALMRHGLRGAGALFIVAGGIGLVAYGLVVNSTGIDFGRLMGIYIAVFFVVSQLVAFALFKEPLNRPEIVGGALIIAGGLVLTFWTNN